MMAAVARTASPARPKAGWWLTATTALGTIAKLASLPAYDVLENGAVDVFTTATKSIRETNTKWGGSAYGGGDGGWGGARGGGGGDGGGDPGGGGGLGGGVEGGWKVRKYASRPSLAKSSVLSFR